MFNECFGGIFLRQSSIPKSIGSTQTLLFSQLSISIEISTDRPTAWQSEHNYIPNYSDRSLAGCDAIVDAPRLFVNNDFADKIKQPETTSCNGALKKLFTFKIAGY